MSEQPPIDAPIAIAWLSKADLLHARPDLEKRAGELTQAEVEYLAEKLGDALQESYWLALEVVLDDYVSRVEGEGE
jgi:hypothetical protein